MRKFIYVLLFMVLSVSLFAQPTTSTLIRRAELGDSTAALRTFINLLGPTDSTTFRAYSNSLYLYKSDTTSTLAMQWELDSKLAKSDTTSSVAMQWELDGKLSDSTYIAYRYKDNNFTVGQTITGNSAIVGTTGSPQLTIGTPNATAASSNQFFDKWDIYNPILAMYKTTNDWHGTLQTQLQLDSTAYGFSKTAHLTDAYLSTKLRVGSTDTVHNSASGGSSSLSLDVVDGAQFVGNSDTTMGAYPTTYLTGHRGEINFRRWNKRAINTGLNPDVLSVYLATVNFDNVDSTHIQKVGGYTNIMSYSPPHVVIDTAIGFWSKQPANINGTLSNFYHFYGEGNYPSYFGGKVQMGTYTDGTYKSGLADLFVKGIARIEDYGYAGLTINTLTDATDKYAYLSFDSDSVAKAGIYWDVVKNKLVFGKDTTAGNPVGFNTFFKGSVGFGSTTNIDSISVVGDSLRTYTNGKWTAAYLHNSFDNILWSLLLLGILVTVLIRKRYGKV